MHDTSLQNGSSCSRRSVFADRIPLHHLDKVSRMAEAGCNAIKLSVLPVDEALVRAAETNGILYQGLQHCLQIEGGAADDLKHISGGGLLLQEIRAARDQTLVFSIAMTAWSAKYRRRFDHTGCARFQSRGDRRKRRPCDGSCGEGDGYHPPSSSWFPKTPSGWALSLALHDRTAI